MLISILSVIISRFKYVILIFFSAIFSAVHECYMSFSFLRTEINVEVRVSRINYFITANINPNISVEYHERRNRIRVTPLFHAPKTCVFEVLSVEDNALIPLVHIVARV